VDDRYSTNTNHRGEIQHYGGYRSRADTQKEATWRPKVSSKRVTFANPLANILSEHHQATDLSVLLVESPCFKTATSFEWFDPMHEEVLKLSPRSNTSCTCWRRH
jgi:hypothetical protein